MPLPEAVIHYGPSSQQVGPARSAEGDLAELDTLSLDYLIPCTVFAQWKAAAASAGFTRGSAVPSWSTLFVRDMSAEEEGDSHALITVNGHGLLPGAGDKRKRIIAAAGQIIGVGPIEQIIVVTNKEETGTDPSDDSTVPAKRRIPKVDDDGEVVYKTISTPTGTADRWNINQAFLTVSDTYFATSEPSTTVIGTAQTPPTAPTPPSYIWGSYGEVMRANHPSGWVLDDRQSEEIVPGSLWRVTDSFGYYYVAQPD